MNEGYTDTNIFQNVTLDKAINDKAVHIPNDEEVNKLVSYVSERYESNKKYINYRDVFILTIVLEMGLRSSEILSMKKNDIVFQNNSATIMIQDDNGNRKLEASDELSYMLQYLFTFEEVKDSKEYIFLSQKKRPLSKRQLQTTFSQLSEKAGVEHVTLQSLRRYFIFEQFKKGRRKEDLQRILGLDGLDMIDKYYRIFEDLKGESK